MKKIFLFICLLIFTQNIFSQEDDEYSWWVCTVPAFHLLDSSEPATMFIAVPFRCYGDFTNEQQNKFMVMYSKYLRTEYNIWTDWSDPLTEANINASIFQTKEEADSYYLNIVADYSDSEDQALVKSRFTVKNCNEPATIEPEMSNSIVNGISNSSNSNVTNEQNNYEKLNNTYNTTEALTNAVFGVDSDAGKMVQNLNTANQMYGALENGNYSSAANNLINIFSNAYENRNSKQKNGIKIEGLTNGNWQKGEYLNGEKIGTWLYSVDKNFTGIYEIDVFSENETRTLTSGLIEMNMLDYIFDDADEYKKCDRIVIYKNGITQKYYYQTNRRNWLNDNTSKIE